ncbi:MAG: SLC13 family permease [Candidatus Omnitrophica bacterium]|nr:SLC13 family permease [Candidatus Omnitrophota bacterium]
MNSGAVNSKNRMFARYITYFIFILISWFLGSNAGLNNKQALALSVFFASISGTIFFWQYRLSFALWGSALLVLLRIVTVKEFVSFASLEVILFLIGMMIITGNLKELGFFDWILSKILKIRRFSSGRFLFLLIFVSAVSACCVDEVSSIIFMVILILTICDYFEVNPAPFIIISVLATNVGSTGTVLGNPIGILIASKAGLTFESFIKYSFPVMIFLSFVLYGISLLIFSKPLRELSKQIDYFGPNDTLSYLIKVPADKDLRIGITIAALTFTIIAFHHKLELLLGLDTNNILLIAPLISAGILMAWRKRQARIYVEQGVEWWTIIFFLFLFAQSGVLEHTGVTQILAGWFSDNILSSYGFFIAFVLIFSAVISSMVDNVILVAAFIPVLNTVITLYPQYSNVAWWVLLYGACIGGNITFIGSTANIVALGMIEKRNNIYVGFLQWIIPGLVSTVILLSVAFLFFRFLPMYR